MYGNLLDTGVPPTWSKFGIEGWGLVPVLYLSIIAVK